MDEDTAKTSDMVVKKPEDIGEADFANYFCTYGACAGRRIPSPLFHFQEKNTDLSGRRV